MAGRFSGGLGGEEDDVADHVISGVLPSYRRLAARRSMRHESPVMAPITLVVSERLPHIDTSFHRFRDVLHHRLSFRRRRAAARADRRRLPDRRRDQRHPHQLRAFHPADDGDLGLSREAWGMAMAIQNLAWGIAQPFAGGFADRYGTAKVSGRRAADLRARPRADGDLARWARCSTSLPASSCGVGIATSSFSIVMVAFGRNVPQEQRPPDLRRRHRRIVVRPVRVRAAGPGIHRQFRLAERADLFRRHPRAGHPADLRAARQKHACCRKGRPQVHGGAEPGLGLRLLPAAGDRLLRLRLPPRLHQRPHAGLSGVSAACRRKSAAGRSPSSGCSTSPARCRPAISAAGCPSSCCWRPSISARAVAIGLFMLFPVTEISAYIFAAAMGLLWLSTVPLTAGLVSLFFGARYMGMLYGLAFFSHQLGSFVGVWLGGYAFDVTGLLQPRVVPGHPARARPRRPSTCRSASWPPTSLSSLSPAGKPERQLSQQFRPGSGCQTGIGGMVRLSGPSPPAPEQIMSDQSPPARELSRVEFIALVAALMALNALAIDVMLPALPYMGEALGICERERAAARRRRLHVRASASRSWPSGRSPTASAAARRCSSAWPSTSSAPSPRPSRRISPYCWPCASCRGWARPGRASSPPPWCATASRAARWPR